MLSSGQGKTSLAAVKNLLLVETTCWLLAKLEVSYNMLKILLRILPGRDYYNKVQPILPPYSGTEGDIVLTLPPGVSAR